MRTLALVALNGLLLCGVSSAALVDFTTSGDLSCGAAANCSEVANVLFFSAGLGQPTLAVSYLPNAESNLNASPTATTSFGYLNVQCLVCTNASTFFNLAGAALGITINQGPDPFTQSGLGFIGTFNGGLSLTNGNMGGIAGISFGSLPIVTTFSNGSPSVRYQLQQPTPPPVAGYAVSAANNTSIQGVVTVSDVPEPASLSLIAFGIGSILLYRRRSA